MSDETPQPSKPTTPNQPSSKSTLSGAYQQQSLSQAQPLYRDASTSFAPQQEGTLSHSQSRGAIDRIPEQTVSSAQQNQIHLQSSPLVQDFTGTSSSRNSCFSYVRPCIPPGLQTMPPSQPLNSVPVYLPDSSTVVEQVLLIPHVSCVPRADTSPSSLAMEGYLEYPLGSTGIPQFHVADPNRPTGYLIRHSTNLEDYAAYQRRCYEYREHLIRSIKSIEQKLEELTEEELKQMQTLQHLRAAKQEQEQRKFEVEQRLLENQALQPSQQYFGGHVQSVQDSQQLLQIPVLSVQDPHVSTRVPTIDFPVQRSDFPPATQQVAFPNVPPPIPGSSMSFGQYAHTSRGSAIPSTSFGVPLAISSFETLSMTEDTRHYYIKPVDMATDEVSSSTSGLLRPDVPEFIPCERAKGPHRHEQNVFKHRSKRLLSQPVGSESSPHIAKPRLEDVRQKLRTYALQALSHCSDPSDPRALEYVKRNVTRIPAVCFNEQKFEQKEGYQVLKQPQSPAVRGQEALSRVCFALEQTLRHRARAATIISDYKFKENYLKNAPPEVLSVLPRPQDEGCHNILMTGPEIGIVCVQVTCVETSTNDGTVKKQVRDTLKQAQKDVKVMNSVLRDLGLDDGCVNMIMALPNVTAEQLRDKLEPKSIQIMSAILGNENVFDNLLTLDYLPPVGHHHWSDWQSRDRIRQWLQRLVARSVTLSLDDYMQIFARYTCGWSQPEVWSASKPRVQIRSWAHAVSETFRRYHVPALTAQQDHLLLSDQAHVLIEARPGSGATCLLKVKVVMELRRGCVVFVFVPRNLIGLREIYEDLATSNTEQYPGRMFLCSNLDEKSDTGISQSHFTSASGVSGTLAELKGNDDIFVLFDHVSPNAVAKHIAGMKNALPAVWIVTEKPLEQETLSLEEEYYRVQMSLLSRVPTEIQIMINHATVRQEDNLGSQTASGSASDRHPSSFVAERHPHGEVEASIYLGLPTDGPLPLFIWHTTRTGSTTGSGIYECSHCMNQLQTALLELIPEFTQKAQKPDNIVKTRLAIPDKAQLASSRPSAETVGLAGSESGSREKPDERTTAEEASIDINSGNVPPPLTIDDVVIFTDCKEGVLKGLDLDNLKDVVFTLENFPQFVGIERAVVGYIGILKVDGTDKVLSALISKVGDVMTLCQGQLILALQVESESIPEQRQKPAARQPDPYQLFVEEMLEQALREHGM